MESTSIRQFMEKEFLNLPFTEYDTAFLESLPDEVFFAHRYKMSAEDEALLLRNSSIIRGKRFYRAKIKRALEEKYAALTNPKEGEPGTKTNPLVRFGKEFVYSENGDLVPYRKNVKIEQVSGLSEDQRKMILEVAERPITYERDCPKSSKEQLQRFAEFGRRRNQERAHL